MGIIGIIAPFVPPANSLRSPLSRRNPGAKTDPGCEFGRRPAAGIMPSPNPFPDIKELYGAYNILSLCQYKKLASMKVGENPRCGKMDPFS